jgi:hypothetical protein
MLPKTIDNCSLVRWFWTETNLIWVAKSTTYHLRRYNSFSKVFCNIKKIYCSEMSLFSWKIIISLGIGSEFWNFIEVKWFSMDNGIGIFSVFYSVFIICFPLFFTMSCSDFVGRTVSLNKVYSISYALIGGWTILGMPASFSSCLISFILKILTIFNNIYLFLLY